MASVWGPADEEDDDIDTLGRGTMTSKVQTWKGSKMIDKRLASRRPDQSLAGKAGEMSLDDMSRWEIEPEEIELGQKLGGGAFGTVYRGRLRGKEVAIKRLNTQEIDEEALDSFRKEVAVMSKLRHPNALLFMGACTTPGNLMIVMELMPRGSVHDLIRKEQVSFKRKMMMAKEAALGMNWLHCSKPAFIHRDLKAGNLLVDQNYTVKVADFGLAHMKESVGEGSFGTMGTPLWMAPEVMRREVFDEKADVYSMGVVLWEFLTRKPPFPHHRDFAIFQRAICEENERPPIPGNCPPALKTLMEQCWDADPKKRPSMPEVEKVLEQIIVDAAIPDECGRVFWKDFFIDEESLENPIETIDWSDFVFLFHQFLESDPIPLPAKPSPPELQNASMAQIREFVDRGQEQFLLVHEVFTKAGREMNEEQEYKKVVAELEEKLEWKCLKELLLSKTKDGREIVRMEQFGSVLGFLGPLHVSRGGATVPGSFLRKVVDVLRTQWFYGPLDGSGAIRNLKNKEPGTFLVRFSSQPGFFSISNVTDKKAIQHYRIIHEPASTTFKLDGADTVYSSLVDLIHEHKASLKLTVPCPEGPYDHLFVKDEDANEGNLCYSQFDV
mmetsp:Transcript_51575/g.129377  ORF Transcript_51575/g.129377 Transcript_51575/m.129377 type:complete len:611 (-) Transcript_51575:33-1865(-)